MDSDSPSFLSNPDLGLILFGGKGGVGKTTCAAAASIALTELRPGKRFQVLSTDPAHSLLDSLAGSPLPPNLKSREIDFPTSLEKFKATHEKAMAEILQRGSLLDADGAKFLLDLSVPGFEELMAYYEISNLLEEDPSCCLIVDTAPTGHTLRFLELPGWIRGWIAALDGMLEKHRFLAEVYAGSYQKDKTDEFLGELTETVERLERFLSDPDKCRFVPVMLAEALSINETIRLISRLRKQKIAVTDIVVNRLQPANPDCQSCLRISRKQDGEMVKIWTKLGNFRLWGLPLQKAEVRGSDRLQKAFGSLYPLQKQSLPTDIPSIGIVKVVDPANLPSSQVSLLLVAGKGGVGKTTMACALALRMALQYPEKTVLLLSTDPAHSLSDCLGVKVGAEGVQIIPGLTAIEGDAEKEFAKMKTLFRSEVKAAFRATLSDPHLDLQFEEGMVLRLLDLTPPGLDEIMALLRAIESLETGKCDLLILDTSPTGHLLGMLEMPELLQAWVKVAFDILLKNRPLMKLPKINELMVEISKRLKVLRSLLRDEKKSGLLAVSILTDMAWEETGDLIAACGRLKVAVPTLFLNLATPDSSCSFCAGLAEGEAEVRRKFQRDFPLIEQTVVYRGDPPLGVEALTTLGNGLFKG